MYQLAAVQFLGSLESGLGMPSISKWAEAQQAHLETSRAANKAQVAALTSGFEIMKLQAEYQQKMEAAETDEERVKIEKELAGASAAIMLRVVWTTAVVDITATLHEACQMVFFDQSVDKAARKERAYGVRNLGEIFQACRPPPGYEEKDAKTLYEEAAFAAMLETVKRKDEAAYAAGAAS